MYFFWFDKWTYTEKNLSFIRINWMGAKTKDYKVDWLYPATQYNYDGNLPKKYRCCFGAKKTKKSNQIRSNKNINMMSKDFPQQSKSISPF